MHRGFGNSIHVHQLRVLIPMPLKPGCQALHFQSLTTKNDVAQRQRQRRGCGRFRSHELTKGTGRLIQHRVLFTREQFVKFLRRPTDMVGDDHQPASIEPRPPDFPDTEVKGRAVEKRPHIRAVKSIQRLGRLHEPRDIAMRHHTSLRLPRGTARVNDIGRIVRCDFHRWIFAVPARLNPFILHENRPRTVLRKTGGEASLRQ